MPKYGILQPTGNSAPARRAFGVGLWAWAVLCAWGWACAPAVGQVLPAGNPPAFLPTPLTTGLRPVMALNGEWNTSGADVPPEVQVPFTLLGEDELTLDREFFLRDSPTDTLYIYLAGLAPTAQVFVNGRLLALVDAPFQEHRVAVPPGVLRNQWNLLRVHLLQPAARAATGPNAWLPAEPVLGIYRPVFLMAVDSLAPRFTSLDTTLAQQWPAHDSLRALMASQAPLRATADTVIIYADWDATHGLDVPAQLRSADFAQARLLGARYIYFPLGAHPDLVALARQNALQPVAAPGPFVAVYREYYPAGYPNAPRWQLADGTQTRAIRQYLNTQDPAPYTPGLVFHIIALTLGLLLLVATKLAVPQAFDAIVLRFEGLRPLLAPAREATRYSGQGGLVLWLAGIVFQALGLFYVLRLTWLLNNADGSFAYLYSTVLGAFSQPALSPITSFTWVLALILGLQVWRFATAGAAQLLYGFTGFTDALARAEVLGYLPLWPLVFLLAATPLLSPQAGQGSLALAATVLAIVAHIYHFTTFWLRVSTTRELHPVAKTLYICGVEILPLAFLL